MREIRACVTFDVDLTDHAGREFFPGELDEALAPLLAAVRKRKGFKATWFLRIDGQIDSVLGKPDYVFRRLEKEIQELRQAGHEIGWHPHCSVSRDGKWQQNVEVESVVEELRKYAPAARARDLRSVRMGWGFQANAIMKLLADLGFRVDSSAIPRPRYRWEETEKDWTTTPLAPYRPSWKDYRVPGRPELPILEVPMSVAPIPAPYDTETVLRCVNLSYHPRILEQPLRGWLDGHDHLVTVTHPYELLPRNSGDGLIAFSLGAFADNLGMIEKYSESRGRPVSYQTVSELALNYQEQ